MPGERGARILFAPRRLPPLRPDAAHDLPAYRAWLARRTAERMAAGAGAPSPAVPVVVLMAFTGPGAGPAADPGLARRSLGSLAGQTHRHWTLSVAVAPDAPGAPGRALAAVPADRTVRTDVPTGTSVPGALGAALGAAGDRAGDPAVLVLWPGDELAPDALAQLAAALEASGAPLAHADEDRVDAAGRHHGPVLAPDWSPDYLLSAPYLGRALMARRSALVAAGGFRDVPGGCPEHDLMLRLTDAPAAVPHVPDVLYHRCAPSGAPGPWPAAPGPGAVTAALWRRAERATVAAGPLPGTWSLRRVPDGVPRVSVVVPFRDEAALLRTCVDTVTATAEGVDLELVLVDNGSTDPETLSLVDRLAGRADVRVRRDARPFNWPALNNAAAAAASGEVLVFLNNDVECRRTGWLALLAAQARRPDVAAVGARLLYPDGRLQHGGVVIGMGGAAGHVLAGLAPDDPGYLGMAVLTRDTSAVTGACLATRRDVFDALGGFDESLGVDLNDVDYCLRARARGLRVLYEPAAELVHHESPSRGTSGSVPDIERFIDRWEAAIADGDPHLNANLTRVDSSCALRGLEEKGWWQEWRSSLRRS